MRRSAITMMVVRGRGATIVYRDSINPHAVRQPPGQPEIGSAMSSGARIALNSRVPVRRTGCCVVRPGSYEFDTLIGFVIGFELEGSSPVASILKRGGGEE
jgi:hypothetical protein